MESISISDIVNVKSSQHSLISDEKGRVSPVHIAEFMHLVSELSKEKAIVVKQGRSFQPVDIETFANKEEYSFFKNIADRYSCYRVQVKFGISYGLLFHQHWSDDEKQFEQPEQLDFNKFKEIVYQQQKQEVQDMQKEKDGFKYPSIQQRRLNVLTRLLNDSSDLAKQVNKVNGPIHFVFDDEQLETLKQSYGGFLEKKSFEQDPSINYIITKQCLLFMPKTPLVVETSFPPVLFVPTLQQLNREGVVNFEGAVPYVFNMIEKAQWFQRVEYHTKMAREKICMYGLLNNEAVDYSQLVMDQKDYLDAFMIPSIIKGGVAKGILDSYFNYVKVLNGVFPQATVAMYPQETVLKNGLTYFSLSEGVSKYIKLIKEAAQKARIRIGGGFLNEKAQEIDEADLAEEAAMILGKRAAKEEEEKTAENDSPIVQNKRQKRK